MTPANDDSLRMIFLDNIRWLMVVLVVMLHAGVAYSRTVPWWHVLDAQRSAVFDVLNFILDVVLMPVLFFVAGYFAIPSFRRRGAAGFVIAKLRRLGIPLVLLTLFYTPLVPYIRYYGNTPDPSGFFSYWKGQMAAILVVDVVHAQDAATILLHSDEIAQYHLWFLSLLLFFFLCFAAAAKVGLLPSKQDFRERRDGKESTPLGMLTTLLVAGVLMSLGFAIINLVSRDGAWFKVGNILLFQPTRVPLYVGFFLLGVHACSRDWFTTYGMPGAAIAWGIGGLVMIVLLLAMGESFYAHDPPPFGAALTHGLVRTFSCILLIGLLTRVGARKWPRPTKFNRSLAASSYDIYLLHLPVVVILQWVLLRTTLPIGVKFIIVFIAGVGASWVLSTCLIRPYPKTSIAALLAAFVFAAVFVGP